MNPIKKSTFVFSMLVLMVANSLFAIQSSKPHLNHIEPLVLSNPDSAISLLNIVLSQKISDSTLAKTNELLGQAYYYKGSYFISSKFFNTALSTAYTQNTPRYRSKVQESLGMVYEHISEYDKSLESYFGALKLEESFKNELGIAMVKTNIGHIYIKMRQLENGLKYLNSAKVVLENINNTHGMAKVYHYLGKYYAETGNYKRALSYYVMSNDIYTELNNKYENADLNLSISNIYLKQKKYKHAYELLSYNLNNVINKDYQYLVQKNKLLMCRQYLLTNKKEDAIAILGDIKPINTKIQREVYLLELILNLNTESIARIMEQMDNFLLNIDYIDSKKLSSQIAELEVLYKTEKQQELIKEQSKVIAEQRTKIIIVTASVLIVLVLTILLFRYHIKLKKSYKHLYEKTKSSLFYSDPFDKPKGDEKLTEEEKLTRNILSSIHNLLSREKLFLNPDLSIEELAQKCNTNKSYISKAINSNTSDNFNSFINNYRVKESLELMKIHESLSINEIAYSSGFNSKSSFYRAFTKSTGMSPSQYKEFLITDKI